MSKSKRELSDAERALWRRVAAGVRTRAGAPKGATRSLGLAAAPDAGATALQTKSGPLADRGEERRVRRGRVRVDATLDLHGHNLTTAPVALGRFLKAASARGDRTVVVVTGVGRAGLGVLKAALPGWLEAPAIRGMLSGHAAAHRQHGGEGARYVFLKQR